MPRILLYEFLTSGGLRTFPVSGPEASSLFREGRAMVTALAADFVAGGFETVVMRDVRFPEIAFPDCEIREIDSASVDEELLGKLSAKSDATIVIAPEFDGLLWQRCCLVVDAGGRLLGPSPEIVALTGDKHRTAEHLIKSGIAAPRGLVLQPGEPLPDDFPHPALLKPRHGAGSQNMRFISTEAHFPSADCGAEDAELRLEPFIPGLAASVAVLCGPHGLRPLLPCCQRLSSDGRFHYLGGSLPLPIGLQKRAQQLAVAAIQTLPNPCGYLGVDLVLGDDSSGRGDTVIEINPRMTTSYIGLRAAAKCNLAAAMWSIARGESSGVGLSFGDDPLEFDADGTVRPC